MNKVNLRNPCLDCDQLNEDKKKNPKCIPCTKPAEYDKLMGDMSGSLPDGVAMDGDGGYNVEDFISYGEPKEGQDTMSKREEVEILIASICEDNLVTPEAVRAGGRSVPITTARHEIIAALSSTKFDVPQADIAKLVGVTYAAVNLVATQKRKAAMKEQQPESPKEPSGSVLMITLDFTGLKDVYEWLDKTAKVELRTRENMALFVLKEKYKACHFNPVPE